MTLKQQYIEICKKKAEIRAMMEFDQYVSQTQNHEPAPEVPEDDGDELLTAKQAAEFMQVSIGTVYAWEKSGRLKSRGSGRSKRYTKSACLRALKTGR